MYNYSIGINESMIIKTPNVNKFSDLKVDLKQTADCNINHSIYPDGTDVTFTQLYNKIIISSNKEIIKNDDGTYSFKN